LFFPESFDAKANVLLTHSLLDNRLQAVEGTPANEKDVRRIDLNELLLRMLAAALGGNGGAGALNQLQKGLLHAFAADVSSDGNIGALACDFVNLVDVNDAALGFFHIKIRTLQKTYKDILDILTDIPGLGKSRRIRHTERHIENPRQRLR